MNCGHAYGKETMNNHTYCYILFFFNVLFLLIILRSYKKKLNISNASKVKVIYDRWRLQERDFQILVFLIEG